MKHKLISTAAAIFFVAHSTLGQITLENAYDEFVKAADVLKEGDMKAYYKSGNEFSQNSSTYAIADIVKESGKVVSFKLDVDSWYKRVKFVPDNNQTPVYWIAESNDLYYGVVIYKDNILILPSENYLTEEFKIITWVKIGSGKKGLLQGVFTSSGGSVKPPFTNEEVLEYLKPFKDSDKQRRENEQKNKEAAAAALRDKYSIKGKEVAKIEIEVKHGQKVGHGTKFDYGIVAVLKDGTQIKTKNLGGEGYIDDYEITIHGDIEDDYINGRTISFKPYDYKGDYIQITAKSKHHPTLTPGVKKVVMTYDSPITLNYNANNSTGKADAGKSLRIDVKVVTHSETKEEILEYRVYDDSAKMLHKFRLQRDVLLKVLANGGKSGNCQDWSNSARKCEDGGDGGNIYLNLDPKVGENYLFDYSNIGGKGGVHKTNPLSNGKDGRDGKFVKTIKTIN